MLAAVCKDLQVCNDYARPVSNTLHYMCIIFIFNVYLFNKILQYMQIQKVHGVGSVLINSTLHCACIL